MDQLQMCWPVLSPILHHKLIMIFSISSVIIQSVCKIDSLVKRFIRAASVAHHKMQIDGVTSGLMTSPSKSRG